MGVVVTIERERERERETLTTLPHALLGLYLPEEKKWLDDTSPLSMYDSLQEEEYIEYRDRDAVVEGEGKGGGGGGCCTVM